MPEFLKKAHDATYKLMKEDGRQSELNDIVESTIIVAICLNVMLVVFESVTLDAVFAPIISTLRTAFFIFFLTEYILRVWVADVVMNDKLHPVKSRIRYMLTFRAIVDLLALMPVMLGGTIIDFRIFRVLRLLKVTQIKTLKHHTDILSKVLKLKGAQLLSSLFILLIFILVCAVVIYDLEYPAQPEVFSSVLSGFWWAISAVTTIGYGDMYPITPLGKVLGSLMSIFGVFLMAVPVGILTTGFFEISKSANAHSKRDKKQE